MRTVMTFILNELIAIRSENKQQLLEQNQKEMNDFFLNPDNILKINKTISKDDETWFKEQKSFIDLANKNQNISALKGLTLSFLSPLGLAKLVNAEHCITIFEKALTLSKPAAPEQEAKLPLNNAAPLAVLPSLPQQPGNQELQMPALERPNLDEIRKIVEAEGGKLEDMEGMGDDDDDDADKKEERKDEKKTEKNQKNPVLLPELKTIVQIKDCIDNTLANYNYLILLLETQLDPNDQISLIVRDVYNSILAHSKSDTPDERLPSLFRQLEDTLHPFTDEKDRPDCNDACKVCQLLSKTVLSTDASNPYFLYTTQYLRESIYKQLYGKSSARIPTPPSQLVAAFQNYFQQPPQQKAILGMMQQGQNQQQQRATPQQLQRYQALLQQQQQQQQQGLEQKLQQPMIQAQPAMPPQAVQNNPNNHPPQGNNQQPIQSRKTDNSAVYNYYINSLHSLFPKTMPNNLENFKKSNDFTKLVEAIDKIMTSLILLMRDPKYSESELMRLATNAEERFFSFLNKHPILRDFLLSNEENFAHLSKEETYNFLHEQVKNILPRNPSPMNEVKLDVQGGRTNGNQARLDRIKEILIALKNSTHRPETKNSIESIEKEITEFESLFTCPIDYQLLLNPVILSTGKPVSAHNANILFSQNKFKCPHTNNDLKNEKREYERGNKHPYKNNGEIAYAMEIGIKSLASKVEMLQQMDQLFDNQSAEKKSFLGKRKDPSPEPELPSNVNNNKKQKGAKRHKKEKVPNKYQSAPVKQNPVPPTATHLNTSMSMILSMAPGFSSSSVNSNNKTPLFFKFSFATPVVSIVPPSSENEGQRMQFSPNQSIGQS